MKRVLAGLLLCVCGVFAQDMTIVYMGILPGAGREFHTSFDALLREQILVIPGVAVADFDETELLKNKTRFAESPHISRSFVEAMMLVASERTLIVWAEVRDVTIKPVRRWLVGTPCTMTISGGSPIPSKPGLPGG